MGEIEELFSTGRLLESFENDLCGKKIDPNTGETIVDGEATPVLKETLIKRWIGIIRPYVSNISQKSNLGEDQIREICSQLHNELSEYVFLNWDEFTYADDKLQKRNQINQINTLVIQTLHFVYIALSSAKEGGLRSTIFGRPEMFKAEEVKGVYHQ